MAAPSPEALAASMELESTVLWVHGGRVTHWGAWGPFLERFVRASRAHPARRCGAIGITLDGSVAASHVRTDAGVRVARWRGRISRLDVQLYLALHLHQGGRRSLEEALRIGISTELGGPDVPFALELARRPLRELLDPLPILRAQATSRGWNGTPGPDAWAEGRIDELDGRAFEHSASIVSRGEIAPILQRMWRAELTVIFPELEERRVQLVQQLKPFLRPMETMFGPIERVEDLELAHILFQLRNERVSAQTRSTLHHLNELRKSLAHLEPVRPENLVGARLVDAALLARPSAA